MFIKHVLVFEAIKFNFVLDQIENVKRSISKWRFFFNILITFKILVQKLVDNVHYINYVDCLSKSKTKFCF